LPACLLVLGKRTASAALSTYTLDYHLIAQPMLTALLSSVRHANIGFCHCVHVCMPAFDRSVSGQITTIVERSSAKKGCLF